MNKTMIRNISMAIIGFILVLVSCDTDNDFYEVGKQPVFLTYPSIDTTWVLDYQKPDTLWRFSWESQRYFIDFNLILSFSEDLTDGRMEVFTGIKRDFTMTTITLDSILSDMGIQIGEKRKIYWSVQVIDPEAGWSDQVRSLSITRCDLPTNVIMLGKPESLSKIELNKETPEDSVEFTWNCESQVKDYVLQLSLNQEFNEPLEYEKGSLQSQKLSYEDLDKWLEENGIGKGEDSPVYWRVNGTGTPINPIESSAVREISIQRFARDPVNVILKTPEQGSEILLEVAQADEPVKFEWECDTTEVTFKIKMYDKELGVSHEFDAGSEKSFSILQVDLDQILEQKFEMVASQKKKMYWEITPSDPLRAVSESTGEFIIRRFPAMVASQPITLVNAPADNTAYVLDYNTPDNVLASVSWDCEAFNVTYAIEYSLNADMSNPKVKALDKNKNVDFTHQLLDEILSDAGGAYLTKTLYWRITSTVNVQTEPSAIRSLQLTGMLKPFVDLRDPSNPETYKVVKIGNNFWMAENLRATRYSDGTEFTAVDVASKSYSEGAVANPKITGQYYTWPTALRDWQQADNSDNKIIQGVCPDGWHISTKAEWNELISAVSPGPATSVKSTDYWNQAGGITNSTGLNVVPAGIYWHQNVGIPDNGASDLKTGFWTTSVGSDAGKAFMFEMFDWSQEITPWDYPCRPWSEGDGTASRVVNVRCVKTLD